MRLKLWTSAWRSFFSRESSMMSKILVFSVYIHTMGVSKRAPNEMGGNPPRLMIVCTFMCKLCHIMLVLCDLNVWLLKVPRLDGLAGFEEGWVSRVRKELLSTAKTMESGVYTAYESGCQLSSRTSSYHVELCQHVFSYMWPGQIETMDQSQFISKKAQSF